jgi:hypothetical protein
MAVLGHAQYLSELILCDVQFFLSDLKVTLNSCPFESLENAENCNEHYWQDFREIFGTVFGHGRDN